MNKANTIAAGLKAKGYNVVWAEETADQIAVAIDFVKNREMPWIRAFHLDNVASDVPAFMREIEEWKTDVRKHLSFGVASDTVRSVITHYGLDRTEKAMKAVGL